MNLWIFRHSLPAVLSAVLIMMLLPSDDAIAETAPKREFRGAWISTVYNLDWPSSQQVSAADQQAELITMLDDLQDMGINAVIFQVKPNADAFYPSEYAPWSEWLTGVQGQAPDYDPLAFALDEARKRNMEFHAWFNPYRVSTHSDLDRLAADHPVRNHLDWLVEYDGRLYFDPGIPGARQFIIDSVLEVVKNYDIDGVHFDDHFYPYPGEDAEEFHDEESFDDYGDGFSHKADWRRNNVDQLIEELSAEIKSVKPHVLFGISPFGIWRNQSSDPNGSATNGFESYDQAYADSRKWVREGWVDYILPQLYWNIGYAPADYAVLLEWWSNVTVGTDVELYIGHSIYKIGSDNGWNDPLELNRQIELRRMTSGVTGSAFFSTRNLQDNPLNVLEHLRSDVYARPALPPERSGPALVSPVPQAVSAVRETDGVRLSWPAAADSHVRSYVIYRSASSGSASALALEDMVAVLPAGSMTEMSFTDTSAGWEEAAEYVVTTLNRYYTESEASIPAEVVSGGEKLPGDANGDGVITIGDLGLLVFWLGKTNLDSDWQEVAHMDLNKDGRLGEADLRLLARCVLGPC